MNAVRFFATIGEDQTIRLPKDIQLTPGEAEVIVLQPVVADGDANRLAETHIFDRLARAAEELSVNTDDLPLDLAENHDFYLHGLPKGTDRS